MSNEKQETIADIVKEMRTLGRLDEKSTDKIPRSLQALGLRTYADRIEAAVKMEREAGAEAAQICGEIGEMIGRESHCKEVTNCNRLGNAAKMREAFEAVVKVGYPHNFQKEAPHIRAYCYEITTAIKKCFAALSAPPRNCDRHECATTKEAQDTWRKEDGGKSAYYEWLLATSAKGGAE